MRDSSKGTRDGRDGGGGEASAWSPFRYRTFAVLWTATLLSNIGGWMHDVGAGWLMTTLNPSPLLVALVQAATTLPVFLLALPAGALADIVDRRRLLLIAKIYMVFVAASMGLVVLAGKHDAGGAARVHACTRRGDRVDQPRVASDRAAARAATRARVGRRAEQRRHQREPRDRTCACRRRNREPGPRVAVSAQCR